MSTLSRREFTFGLAAAAGLALTGCSSSGKKPKATTNGPLQKVTVLTALGTFGRESFLWVAKDKGFFQEAGLDVTIQPGAAGDSNTNLIASGKAQFAEVDYSGAVIRMAKDNHDVKIVSAVTQQTMISLMALPGRGISNPADLPGKTIGVTPGSVIQTMFPTYAKRANFDASLVKWVNLKPDQLPMMLAAKQVDAIGLFVVGAASVKKASGQDPVILPYSQYMSDLYGNVMVASTTLVEQNPALVKAFNGAMLKGLQYAIDNPEEAAEILHKAVPAQAVDSAIGEVQKLGAYVKADLAGKPIGTMDPSKVARSIAILQGVGLMPAGLTPDQVAVFDAVPAAA